MAFKQELLKKIQIDRLTNKVLATIGHSGTEQKVDKVCFQILLEMAGYRHYKERDLDLYLPQEDSGRTHILVLDNDLPFYNTTIPDIAMRKSPTVKEMVNIRNAIKILNDKDVVISRKADSVKTVHNECLSRLDLSFSRMDLGKIAEDGASSLEHGYIDGVQECLDLFVEMLHYQPAPRTFMAEHHRIAGTILLQESGEMVFGPIVGYNLVHNRLFALNSTIESWDRVKIDNYLKVIAGDEKASFTGGPVFSFLAEEVIRKGYSPS